MRSYDSAHNTITSGLFMNTELCYSARSVRRILTFCSLRTSINWKMHSSGKETIYKYNEYPFGCDETWLKYNSSLYQTPFNRFEDFEACE